MITIVPILSQKLNEIVVEKYIDPFEYHQIVDDWKKAGKYSHQNLFDGNSKTCFAYYNVHSAANGIGIIMKKKYKINKFGIINGFTKNNWLYHANSRVKKINIILYRDKKIVFEKKMNINDTMKLQVFAFSKAYWVNSIDFIFLTFYKGKVFSDVCVSELKFYNNKSQYQFEKKSVSRKKYIKEKNTFLKKLFFGKKLKWDDCGPCNFSIWLKSDGSIVHENTPKFLSNYRMPHPLIFKAKKWKIKRGVFYFYTYGKWKYVKFNDYNQYLPVKIEMIGNKKLIDQQFMLSD